MASDQVAEARLAQREIGGGLAWHVERSRRVAARTGGGRSRLGLANRDRRKKRRGRCGGDRGVAELESRRSQNLGAVVWPKYYPPNDRFVYKTRRWSAGVANSGASTSLERSYGFAPLLAIQKVGPCAYGSTHWASRSSAK